MLLRPFQFNGQLITDRYVVCSCSPCSRCHQLGFHPLRMFDPPGYRMSPRRAVGYAVLCERDSSVLQSISWGAFFMYFPPHWVPNRLLTSTHHISVQVYYFHISKLRAIVSSADASHHHNFFLSRIQSDETTSVIIAGVCQWRPSCPHIRGQIEKCGIGVEFISFWNGITEAGCYVESHISKTTVISTFYAPCYEDPLFINYNDASSIQSAGIRNVWQFSERQPPILTDFHCVWMRIIAPCQDEADLWVKVPGPKTPRNKILVKTFRWLIKNSSSRTLVE